MRDKSRPHKFPSGAIGEEVIGWRCQACGTWVREFGRYEPGECSVDWRRPPSRMRHLLAIFERRYWGPRTKRRNLTHHRPAVTTRRKR